MHVSRGGWLGQTYALAKFDDSVEGKKSGIRRSKEERKGMVETFIKRYQKSNNGDFPSLNLTRKEVGGSFYTVREIVREIIQENRVLGPPKLPPGDKNLENLDSFLEHNPVGSMSVDDLHVHVVHDPNETQIVEEGMGEQKDKVNGLVTNQSQKHQILEDVVVGDSSLETVNNTVHNMDEKVTENMELESDVVDIQSEEEITHRMIQLTPTLDSHKNQNDSSSEESIVVDVNVDTNELEDSMPTEEKTINGGNSQNLHTSSVQQQSTFDETNANLNKSSDHPTTISQNRRTTATLNRINLESWEAASKKSSRHETHRFVTFVKAFITAFAKFWSE